MSTNSTKTTAMMTELQVPKSRRPEIYQMLRDENGFDETSDASKALNEIDEQAPIYIVSFHKDGGMAVKKDVERN